MPNFVRMPRGPGHYFARESEGNVWGAPHMIKLLEGVSEIWGYIHPEHPFGIGDISAADGRSLEGHNSHRKGVDVDIRAIRTDGAPSVTFVGAASYDAERTLGLVKTFFRTAGATSVDRIFFNDSNVIRAVQKVGPWPNHEDHFHLRLKVK